MNMQDKDFDNLFRTKLGGLEVEPSARVWDNISAELKGPQKRRLSPVWSIAATTVILLSAAAWFLTDRPVKVQQNQVAVQKKQTAVVDQFTESDNKTVFPDVAEQLGKITRNRTDANTIARVKSKPIRQVNTKGEPKIKEPVKSVIVEKTLPVIITETQPVLAAVTKQPERQAVVPDMTLSNQRLTATAENITQPEVIKAPESVLARQPERKKKRGIHTLGGLINAVIAKVDKREDKLIEFTETDDDQADITGINLGLFKVKKEK
jgi:hypothetical protein